jgi:hypothetical protein
MKSGSSSPPSTGSSAGLASFVASTIWFSRMVHRRRIEAAVLDGLRKVLKQPDYLAVYVKAYNEERGRLARGAVRDRSKLERRTGEIGPVTTRLIAPDAQQKTASPLGAAAFPSLEGGCYQIRDGQGDLRING